jgi:hypothetical protein
MNLGTVAIRAGMNPAEAKTLHQRPALIQELWWRSVRGSPPQADLISEIVFSFYNGALFRMVVHYDPYKTRGLTNADMTNTISTEYGVAAKRPSGAIVLFSSSQVYNDQERVIARWEDRRYSCNLYRSSNQPTFGLLIFSKQLDALAQTAVAQAIQLDNHGTPQR